MKTNGNVMKLAKLQIIGVILLVSCLGCDKNREGAPGEVYDAGPVLAGTASLRHQFRVVNTTDRTIRIIDESHSCTCTAIDLRAVSLRPGETRL